MNSSQLEQDLKFISKYFKYQFEVDGSWRPVFHFDRVVKDSDILISQDEEGRINVKLINDDGHHKRYTFSPSAIDMDDRKGTYLEMIDSMKAIIRDIKLKEVL